MSHRTWVLVKDTLITVNNRHLIITRNTLSQKSREAIIYNKSCLQASFKIDVRLIKSKQYFFHFTFFWLPWLPRNLRVRQPGNYLPIIIFICLKRCDKQLLIGGNNSFTMFCLLISLGLKWKWDACIKRLSQREVNYTVAMAGDPYDFENDDYEESSTPNYEPSSMLNFERPEKEEEEETRSLLVS